MSKYEFWFDTNGKAHEIAKMDINYIMSTEQTAFFLHKTTSEKRHAKAFGAFAGSVVKRT